LDRSEVQPSPFGFGGDRARAIVGLRPSFSSHVRFGERGAPVRMPWTLVAVSETGVFIGKLPGN
jgi:hypothetical protein